MNKFTYALALGAGLVLSLAAPNVQAADPIRSDTHADHNYGGPVQRRIHPRDDRFDVSRTRS